MSRLIDSLSRRQALALPLLAAAGCRPRAEAPGVLRLGFFASVAHAPALTLAASGRLAAGLPGVRVETAIFNAGPEAMTALSTRSIDACLVGPLPAATHFLRSRGRALRVLSGVCSGGSALVVRPGAGVRGARDLRGKTVGTPQLGSSQDVALRRYLRANGLRDSASGGEVRIANTASAHIASLFQRGHLDGAWLPEPWVSRLEALGARVLVDERALWPQGSFASAVLVAHPRYAAAAPDNLARLLRMVHAEVEAAERDRLAGLPRLRDAIRALTRVELSAAILARAATRMRFTLDPLPASVGRMVRDAQGLGMLPPGDIAGLFDGEPLRRALA
ncbi:MAG: ABC transporter substrate-binding protein [Polyangiales bacterium]